MPGETRGRKRSRGTDQTGTPMTTGTTTPTTPRPEPRAPLGAASAKPPTILSGITPSASLTLGNYLGALRRFVVAQRAGAEGEHAKRYYFIADLHALTTTHAADESRRLALEAAALYFAAGVDPGLSTVFLQSHVRAHVELAYLLECTAYVGELSRMIQFKEKGGRPKARASLFTYPCLMAAAILLYDAERVPVGGDQDQHVELARELAVRFNREYGETFVVPSLAKSALAARVCDLQEPTRKMSKSAPADAPGVIRMLDDPQVVRRKIQRAVTDSESDVRYDPAAKPGVSNLLDIVAAVTDQHPTTVAAQFTTYGALKSACADAVVDLLEPIQARHAELMSDPDELDRLLAVGADRARGQAEPVVARARSAIGLAQPQG
jgi:tryptophanyl-tRNA synthetase